MSIVMCESLDCNGMLQFHAPSDMVQIGGFRSHHPICVFENGELDHHDWFFRFLDCYNGMQLARYDQTGKRQREEYNKRVVAVRLLSFADWIPPGDIPEFFQKKPFVTFAEYIGQFLFIQSIGGYFNCLDKDSLRCLLAGSNFLQDATDFERHNLFAQVIDDMKKECIPLLLATNCDKNFDTKILDVFQRAALEDELEKELYIAATNASTAKQRAKLFPGETKQINAMRFSMMRARATNICIAMRELEIDALRMCKIIIFACAPMAKALPFHFIWRLVTSVLHFKRSI